MTKIHQFMDTDLPNGKLVSFGVDDDGNLYVNRKLVKTKGVVEFQYSVQVAIVLGGIGAFAQGFVALLSYFAVF